MVRELEERFAGIKPFDKKIWLSSPTMHGKEMEYMQEAYDSNWMSTVGVNIDELERMVAEKGRNVYNKAICESAEILLKMRKA